MKKIIVYSCLALAPSFLFAQNEIENVLQQIEVNNKEIKASSALVTAKQIEAKTENNLPNPTFSYERMWGSPASLGKNGEFTVSQEFDFPTLYVSRKKLAQAKSILYSRQGAEVRLQILLMAKETCLDLILLNRQHTLLSERASNAQRLMQLYRKRIATGDANVLETNKIELELLNAQAALRNNERERTSKLLVLQQLNGGEMLPFKQTEYPQLPALISLDQLREQANASHPTLLSLSNEKELAKQQITVNKSQWLPKFELGYRRDSGLGEQFNGITVGISVPIFENRNKVKQAKAQATYTDMQTASVRLQLSSQLQSLHDQATSLEKIVDDYKRVLQSQKNIELLNKALEAGNISMIEYFIEIMQLYESLDNYYQTENDYQQTVARLNQFTL